MTRSKPRFWQAFDKLERTVGEPLEELVASQTYTEVLIALQKVRRAVRGAVGNVVSGAAESVLHVAQIPSRRDVRRLNNQLVELASEVRTLSARLEEEQAEPVGRTSRAKTSVKPRASANSPSGPGAAPKTRPNAKTKTKTKTKTKAKAKAKAKPKPRAKRQASTRAKPATRRPRSGTGGA